MVGVVVVVVVLFHVVGMSDNREEVVSHGKPVIARQHAIVSSYPPAVFA